MAIEIVIPKLGMTMKEGTIVEWSVPDGAAVEVDQVVFQLSTDKLETEVTAEQAGTLRHGAGAGGTFPTGAVVGWILAEGEAAPAGAGAAAAAGNGHAANGASDAPTATATATGGSSRKSRSGRLVASPYARRLAGQRGLDLGTVDGSGPGGRIVAADVLQAEVATAPAETGAEARVSATPVARRLADQLGVDLAAVTGSGPGGRITKEDVEEAAARPAPARPVGRTDGASATAVLSPAAAGARSVPLRGMRAVIAERMHSSLQEMAQLTLGMEIDMTEAAALRRQLVAEWEADGVRVSYTDLVARAAVKALASHPGLNASMGTETIEQHDEVHLGLAVSVPNGLLVPVVRDAHRASLKELSAEGGRLAVACREGRVGPDDLEGSTFTITALGANGVDFFTPIVNPPNVAILGVGRVHDGVGWEGDRPVRRQLITLSLTIDHRAVDGAPGADFLAAVRSLLESPYRLLV